MEVTVINQKNEKYGKLLSGILHHEGQELQVQKQGLKLEVQGESYCLRKELEMQDTVIKRQISLSVVE